MCGSRNLYNIKIVFIHYRLDVQFGIETFVTTQLQQLKTHKGFKCCAT